MRVMTTPSSNGFPDLHWNGATADDSVTARTSHVADRPDNRV
jgi:hypothetical protein